MRKRSEKIFHYLSKLTVLHNYPIRFIFVSPRLVTRDIIPPIKRTYMLRGLMLEAFQEAAFNQVAEQIKQKYPRLAP